MIRGLRAAARRPRRGVGRAAARKIDRELNGVSTCCATRSVRGNTSRSSISSSHHRRKIYRTRNLRTYEEDDMLRRTLMLLIGVGLAMLGSTIAWSEEADQAALSKAIAGAKISLKQGIAQVAKGTEVPIEAKYEME